MRPGFPNISNACWLQLAAFVAGIKHIRLKLVQLFNTGILNAGPASVPNAFSSSFFNQRQHQQIFLSDAAGLL